MKAPPPLATALAGKRKKFPNPIADPATAIMMASRDPHVAAIRHIYYPNLHKYQRYCNYFLHHHPFHLIVLPALGGTMSVNTSFKIKLMFT